MTKKKKKVNKEFQMLNNGDAVKSGEQENDFSILVLN